MPEFDSVFQQTLEELSDHCRAAGTPGDTHGWYEPGEPSDRFSPDMQQKFDLSSMESSYSQGRSDGTLRGDLAAILLQYSVAAAIRRDWLARRRTRLSAVAHGLHRLAISGDQSGPLLNDMMNVVTGYQEAAHGI